MKLVQATVAPSTASDEGPIVAPSTVPSACPTVALSTALDAGPTVAPSTVPDEAGPSNRSSIDSF